MGDLILSTPAIATVRKSFPDAHVTMVCSVYNAMVMERNTDVDEILSLPREVRPSTFARPLAGQFDLAIALAPRVQDFAIVRSSRAPVRIGYTYVRRYLARMTAPLYLTKLLLSQADPVIAERHPERPVLHEVDQLLNLVAAGGANSVVRALRLDVDDEDRAAVARLPAGCVIFQLGVRWLKAGSTLQSALETVRMLRRFGRPIVVTHSQECDDVAPAFAGVADHVAGNLPFHHWVAAFERSACVVTVDTGATHVAAAMHRPTVVAFEHAHFSLSSREWAPYRVPHVIVRKPQTESDAALTQLREHIIGGVSAVLHA